MSDSNSELNPFASPLAVEPTLSELSGDDLSQAELVRTELLKHEASVRSVGWLYMIGAVVLTLGTIGAFSSLFYEFQFDEQATFTVGIWLLLAILASFMWWAAFGLRRFNPMVRPWVIGLEILALLGGLISFNPIGLAINGYFLWLVGSEKGKRVLSKEYQEIIAATPHIKYKTSVLIWILLGLVVLLIIGGIAAVLLGSVTPV